MKEDILLIKMELIILIIINYNCIIKYTTIMVIESKIDFKDLKRQKNSNKKQFKRGLKEKDYNMISQCLLFVKKYDEIS